MSALRSQTPATGAERARDESFGSVMVALAANTTIAVAKGIAAALTGSPALLAETLHTTADAGNEVFLYIAIRRGRRPAAAPSSFSQFDVLTSSLRLLILVRSPTFGHGHHSRG